VSKSDVSTTAVSGARPASAVRSAPAKAPWFSRSGVALRLNTTTAAASGGGGGLGTSSAPYAAGGNHWTSTADSNARVRSRASASAFGLAIA